ncbi:hypothetical protein F4824DRAFT_482752 [Ustulina deusta]|nr:hypothetical protein F4824DRAFT_482752 [Ustulina deusta]
MSLGVKSLWGAQSRISLVQGLSLVPREHCNLPCRSPLQARCWLSSSAEFPPPIGELEPASVREDEANQTAADGALRDESRGRPRRSAFATRASTSSSAARGRHFLKSIAMARVPSSRATPLIKPWVQYPNKHARRRSLRKHVASSRRQVLHEYTRDALKKPPNDWHSTLDFMVRHTPKFGEMLDFKVGIGKGAAAQARATLSDLDTNLWQIQQRHHCKIRIESGFDEDEPLILSLSGTTVSVRESLLEIVRTVGKVSAVRVLDPALQISSPELGSGTVQGQPIQLLHDGESAAEDETVTVYGRTTDFVKMAQRPRYQSYQLTTRADEIPRPAVWTKSSFEQYVAKLVLARVPTHLHRSLYPVGLDHQATVVHLLTTLFSSEDLRAAASVTALKMALRFIHSRAPVFRPAARTISYRTELQHLPLDAEVFQTFLTAASRARDLQGFNSVLRAMHRKGYYMGAGVWSEFLAMIEDPRIKSYVMGKMRSRGLHHLPPIREVLGRQKAVMDVESCADTEINIQSLLHAQDRLYGTSWLNTVTLNKMIYILGARGNLEACYELLDLVDHDRRVRPDHYTLNTMMTHNRSIPQKIALLSRWPWLSPDGVTYQQLFSAAWKQHLPNMLRVIWRYSVFANLTSSKMRHTLTMLTLPEVAPSRNRAFLKAWQDVILGRRELAAGKPLVRKGAQGFGAVHLMAKYKEEAAAERPLVRLEIKLKEAYDMDMRIHKLKKEGIEMSSSVKDSLTISIPLGTKRGRFKS